MNSHLFLSLKPISSTPFPLKIFIYIVGFIWSFLGKFSPTKILLMRCCQNKASFSWSYQDSSKRSLENNVMSRKGKIKIHTLEIGGHVQMAKSDPEAERTSSLSDCIRLENEYGSFNLEILKFLMDFREPGSSLYFIFISYILIFFLFSFFYTHSFIFLLLFHFFFFFQFFFVCSPLNSKIALYLPPPPCLVVCSSSGKEVIEIR
jgi:hypothetical protein